MWGRRSGIGQLKQLSCLFSKRAVLRFCRFYCIIVLAAELLFVTVPVLVDLPAAPAVLLLAPVVFLLLLALLLFVLSLFVLPAALPLLFVLPLVLLLELLLPVMSSVKS